MMRSTQMLKPSEAAVVSGVSLDDMNRAIDRNVLPEGFVTRTNGRRVSSSACVLVAFYFGSAKSLTAEERLLAIRQMGERLSTEDAFWTTSRPAWLVNHEFLAIDMTPFAKSTLARRKLYDQARKLVSSSPETLGGAPVIKGTRIPVHDIAASLNAGHSKERVLLAYPRLTEEQIELAALYARANPLQGRPREIHPLENTKLISMKREPRRKAVG